MPIYLDGRTLVIALSPSEYSAISKAADRLGLSPGRLMARIGRDYSSAGTEVPPSAWIRECTLYAVGYWPAYVAHEKRAHAYRDIMGCLCS